MFLLYPFSKSFHHEWMLNFVKCFFIHWPMDVRWCLNSVLICFSQMTKELEYFSCAHRSFEYLVWRNACLNSFSVILKFPKILKNFLELLYNFFSKALYLFLQSFFLLLLGDWVCCLYNFWNYGELFVETMSFTLSKLCITSPLIPFLVIFITKNGNKPVSPASLSLEGRFFTT